MNFTVKDIAKRYSYSLSTVKTYCSKHPERLPRFFKRTDAPNSPCLFRESDCIAFEEAQLAKQQVAVELSNSLDLSVLIEGLQNY